MEDKKEFYKNLKKTLEETTTFPDKYLYKFIVPSDDAKVKACLLYTSDAADE